MNKLKNILANTSFAIKTGFFISFLCPAILLTVLFSSACVSDIPLVITESQQCANEGRDRIKKHRTLIAEGYILYQPKKSSNKTVIEKNLKTGEIKTREVGDEPEYFSVYTQKGSDTYVGFLAEYISPEIKEALMKNSSTAYNKLSPVKMRIIASTFQCSLETKNVIKIEEIDSGKVLYENKTASREE